MPINRPIESLFNKNNRFFNMFFILKSGMKAKKNNKSVWLRRTFSELFFYKKTSKILGFTLFLYFANLKKTHTSTKKIYCYFYNNIR